MQSALVRQRWLMHDGSSRWPKERGAQKEEDPQSSSFVRHPDQGRDALSGKFTVTRAQARALKKISEQPERRGGGISLDAIRRDMLPDMATELRRMARTYLRTHRGGKELLDGLAIAEVLGVDPTLLSGIRREIGEAARRRKAA
jgi:hypothetical protein